MIKFILNIIVKIILFISLTTSSVIAFIILMQLLKVSFTEDSISKRYDDAAKTIKEINYENKNQN